MCAGEPDDVFRERMIELMKEVDNAARPEECSAAWLTSLAGSAQSSGGLRVLQQRGRGWMIQLCGLRSRWWWTVVEVKHVDFSWVCTTFE